MNPYAWALDAETLVLVPLLAAGYLVALRVYPAPRWRIACYLAGLALIVAVFLTPLETLALHYLLLAHLLQNVVVAEWAPALCLLGLPPTLAAAIARVGIVRAFTHPLVALPLWLATYFLWHLPWAYDAALRHPNSILHLEHGCYFAAGLALWWPVLQGEPGQLSSGAKALYLFSAFAFASPLGLLLALLPNAIYPFYEDAPRLWGLGPLTDQQIAGVTMAVEQAIVFFAAFSFYLLRFFQEEEGGPESWPAKSG